MAKLTKISVCLPEDTLQELDAARVKLAAELRAPVSTNLFVTRLIRLGLERNPHPQS